MKKYYFAILHSKIISLTVTTAARDRIKYMNANG